MGKHKLFVTVFTTIDWVKSAWLVEPILLTSILLMENSARPSWLVVLILFL